jgi:hypothetical protein
VTYWRARREPETGSLRILVDGRVMQGLPDRYILHVGVQRPHKNQAVMVEALAMLQARHPGVGARPGRPARPAIPR